MAFTWNPDSIRYVHTKDPVTGERKDIIFGEATCLSTDTKPTEDVYNGSTALESDTSKVFSFDMDSSQWNEI